MSMSQGCRSEERVCGRVRQPINPVDYVYVRGYLRSFPSSLRIIENAQSTDLSGECPGLTALGGV